MSPKIYVKSRVVQNFKTGYTVTRDERGAVTTTLQICAKLAFKFESGTVRVLGAELRNFKKVRSLFL